MKVVVAHNRYSSAVPSGENMAVDADIAMLREAGVEVIPFMKCSDSLHNPGAKLRASTGPVWAPATRELARILDQEKPDILHLHNVYPLISPWAVRTAKARGVAVIQTVHNYRHSCVAGTHFRDHEKCLKCFRRRVPLPAIQHGCYRGSRWQSALMVGGHLAHQGTWQDVDRFICISEWQASHLRRSGFTERVSVKANAAADPGSPQPPGRDIVFVGRLSHEKGVKLLLDAWGRSPMPTSAALTLIGDGPLRELADARAETDTRIRVLGALSGIDLRTAMASAAIVVVPSVWDEPFGLVVIEAFAAGRAVVATNGGALPELVDDRVGWLCEPNARALAVTMRAALGSPDLPARALAARRKYEDSFSPGAVVQRLIEIYRDVLASRTA